MPEYDKHEEGLVLNCLKGKYETTRRVWVSDRPCGPCKQVANRGVNRLSVSQYCICDRDCDSERHGKREGERGEERIGEYAGRILHIQTGRTFVFK